MLSHGLHHLEAWSEAVCAGAWGKPAAKAETAFRRQSGVTSRVYQVVCSPFRNPLGAPERRAMRISFGKAMTAITRALSRAAGVPDPDLRWRILDGPYFDNQVGAVTLNGRSERIKLEKTNPGEAEQHSLKTSFERRLA